MSLSFLFVFNFALAGMYTGGIDNHAGVTSDVNDFLEAVMVHMQGIIAFLAVMFILIGAILYMTAGGNQTQATIARVCVTGAIIGLALAAAGPSFLRQISDTVFGGAAPTNDIATAPTLIDIITRTLTFLLSIAGIIAIIGLTISGLLYIFAAGDNSQATKAKEAMKYSLVGIILAGSAIIIVRQVVALFS